MLDFSKIKVQSNASAVNKSTSKYRLHFDNPSEEPLFLVDPLDETKQVPRVHFNFNKAARKLIESVVDATKVIYLTYVEQYNVEGDVFEPIILVTNDEFVMMPSIRGVRKVKTKQLFDNNRVSSYDMYKVFSNFFNLDVTKSHVLKLILVSDVSSDGSKSEYFRVSLQNNSDNMNELKNTEVKIDSQKF